MSMLVTSRNTRKRCLPLKGAGKLVTNDTGKFGVLNAFFSSTFMGKFSPHVSMPWNSKPNGKPWRRVNLEIICTNWNLEVHETWQNNPSNPSKRWGWHHCSSSSFLKTHRSKKSPWWVEGKYYIHIQILRNYRPVCLNSVSGKVTDHVLMEVISEYVQWRTTTCLEKASKNCPRLNHDLPTSWPTKEFVHRIRAKLLISNRSNLSSPYITVGKLIDWITLTGFWQNNLINLIIII